MRSTYLAAIALALAACEQGGTSTLEIKAAAEQRAREELKLPTSTPLESSVWVGSEEYDGATVLCGTVSGGADSSVTPKRFAATGGPINWLVFEDAHNPVGPQGEKFQDWSRFCGEGQAV